MSTPTCSAGSGSSRLLLPAALAVQAAWLLPRIGFLPAWGDEQFTLNLIQAQIPSMLEMLGADVHPPLYFLFLKLWVWLLPWPTALIDRARLASVALGLLATVAIDRLWLRDVPPRVRRWFLLLWVFSPFLLLYARMGRSYTAQLLVAAFAIRYAVDWVRHPGMATALRYAVAQCVLLYLHYVPGLALAGVFGLHGLYRIARGERQRVTSFTIAAAICGLAYLPWVGALATALDRELGRETRMLVPSVAFDQVIRLAYTFLSLTVGETLPFFGLVLAAVLTPLVLWMLVQGVPGSREWLPVVLGTLLVAYVLTAKHVILSLTPSRLAFLLPFHLLLLVRGCERSPRAAAVVIPGLVAMSVIAAASYHRQEDFLNRGYLIPFEAIATYASRPLSTGEALLVIDASNIDATPLLAALPPAVPALTAHDDASSREIRRRIEHGALRRVWFLRNTHDVSKERWSTRLAAELAGSFRLVRRTGFVPYGRTDRLAMWSLAWPERPTHLVELLEFEGLRRPPRPHPSRRDRVALPGRGAGRTRVRPRVASIHRQTVAGSWRSRRGGEVPPHEDVQRLVFSRSFAQAGQIIIHERRIHGPFVLPGDLAPQEGLNERASTSSGKATATTPTRRAAHTGLMV